MVFLASSANQTYRQAIQDWLTQSWILKEPDPIFRNALAALLHTLWSRAGAADELSFLPLPCLCARAFGHVPQAALAVNAAWVLLYTASFLLDKIEDEETGHPIFTYFRPGVVANLTTGLILHSERILAELEPDEETGPGALEAVRGQFNRSALETCAGQHRDLTLREPDFQQIWEIVEGKSGTFFALGAFLGARLAVEDPARVAAMTQAGRRLGILIQIRNDLEGFGAPEAAGSDLAGGKRTLPVLYALQVLPEEARARLSALLRAAPADPAAEIEARKMIISAGAVVYLSLEAEKHRQQAFKTLEGLGLQADAARPLLDLLHFAGPPKKPSSNHPDKEP